MLQEDAKLAFKQLLASVGMRSDWSWEQAMRVIVNDGRCPTAAPLFAWVSSARRTVPFRQQVTNAYLRLCAADTGPPNCNPHRACPCLLCRYGALKSLGEKKACFHEYAQQRKNEEKDEARQK